jgi:type II secretory pathway pseudopilin PulG
MRRLVNFTVAAAILVASWSGFYAQAQQQDNLSLGALITNAAQVAGTVNSPAQVNSGNNGASCTYTQTASSSSPSTTFSIQFQDTASGFWTSLVTSGAITSTGPTTPVTIMVYPGIEVSSLPTNVSAAQSLKLPRNWRVSETTSGGTITGTIGCDLLK